MEIRNKIGSIGVNDIGLVLNSGFVVYWSLLVYNSLGETFTPLLVVYSMFIVINFGGMLALLLAGGSE